MRHLIAAATLTLAATVAQPAFAQRVDTRRIDIERALSGNTTCRFNAIHELALVEGAAADQPPVAAWTIQSESEPLAKMRVVLSPKNEKQGLETLGIGFTVTSGVLLPETARFRINEIPTELTYRITGSTDRLSVGITRELEDLWDTLQAAQTFELTLFASTGEPVGAYSWSVIQARRIPELLDLVHWGCTTPDRG